ncbi:MAG: flagellar hook protein FlgE [Alphaproteobacteria bacterium]|jgi:flagellar hook protein FlgE|nr:flagellar hook protein FlgE [Alphaproteobacteria bacterium]MBU0801875.1 flagellar hook protein FlgE [Alphaproteobacteria bacterium]MBU0873760.1 flagellar hook protein FlgE [Alphaproteobacteria bacterium]MBU1403146.1 flagellar hook protein FlgE [Alphaproteobacteria bacterium]MBU1593887.1 flagellar hook protein FlgE [Alphaproteobacteria bacterium]
MSLYGMMRTGVSGMNAQANRLSTVADNIANSGTTGYKRSSTEFSSLIIPTTAGSYTSGGVTTTVRHAVSQQGDLKYTTSGSDLAINGEGFFVVQSPSGSPVLTRAGSFVPDGEGRLVNAAGFYLMGYSFANGIPSAVANGFGGLEQIRISQVELTATPTTAGSLVANLPNNSTAPAAANLPSANAPTAEAGGKSSLVVYDNLGTEVVLDVYFTKTGTNTWEVAVYNQADAAPSTSFPYSSGPLQTQSLSFDPATGKLSGASANNIVIPVPGGASFDLDLTQTTQLALNYTVLDAKVNGDAPSAVAGVEISNDGTVYAQYENGSYLALYKIPIATVQSPDQLTNLPGNVFTQSADSGGVEIGFANEGGRGSIVAGALENSNVDIAEELTNMIESQRSYTANSKVFQTGADLMDVLVNLKR